MKYLSDVDYKRVVAYMVNLRSRVDLVEPCPYCVCVEANNEELVFACDQHFNVNYRCFGRQLMLVNTYRGGRSILVKGHSMSSQKISDFIRHAITHAAASRDVEIMRYVMRAIEGKVWGDVSHIMPWNRKTKAPHICEVELSADVLMRQPVAEAMIEMVGASALSPHMAPEVLLQIARTIHAVDRQEIPTTIKQKGSLVEISPVDPPLDYMDIFGHARQTEREREAQIDAEDEAPAWIEPAGPTPVIVQEIEDDEDGDDNEFETDEIPLPPNHEDE